jgi:hypothetical protein
VRYLVDLEQVRKASDLFAELIEDDFIFDESANWAVGQLDCCPYQLIDLVACLMSERSG